MSTQDTDTSPQDDAPTEAPSPLDDLLDSAIEHEIMRRKQQTEAEESNSNSTMDALTVSGKRTPLASQQPTNASPPPSMLEGLLKLAPLSASKATRTAHDTGLKRPGDPSNRAPRMSLLSEPEERISASTLEGVFASSAQPQRLKSPRPPRASSLARAPQQSPGPPMRLRRKQTSTRLNGSSELSQLLGDQRLPRTRMPKRTVTRAHVEPDGVTPIPPERLKVSCTLSEHQVIPGVLEPVEIGTRTHHRLDFRYNRFERLEVHQALYEHPDVADGVPFAGAKPAFFASHAPLGNGMLARLIVGMYRDGLPLSRQEAILTQLGAPMARSILKAQFAEVADTLAPITAQMLQEQRKSSAELPMPVLYSGRQRDITGHIVVNVDKRSVVLVFTEGEALGSPPEEGISVRLRNTTRGKGRCAWWGLVRQKFFYALVTDNDQARRALRLLDMLPSLPSPDTDEAGLSRLKRWLDQAAAEVQVPKTRLEHAVTFAASVWPALLQDPPRNRRDALDREWFFPPEGLPPEQVADFLSIMETCELLSIDPWQYFNELLSSAAGTPTMVAKDWTPAAWKQSLS